jgi:hypothetical protein
MTTRLSFTDEPLLARGFKKGDVVRKIHPFFPGLSPYVGRVLASNSKTGTVWVQWAWGPEQESPSELVKKSDTGFDTPPGEEVSQLYSSWETRNASERIILSHKKNLSVLLPSIFLGFHRGSTKGRISSVVFEKFSDSFTRESVQEAVDDVFSLSHKIAIYWKDSKRKYKVTKREINSKRVICPRCKGLLKPRSYTHQNKLLSCKNCGFAIHPGDLIP